MNALNPFTLPLRGTHLIEASAGTGKTYTIAALYVRFMLGHDIERVFTPQHILVVTFTQAATEELRDRIRQRLSESAQYFREQIETQDLFLVQLRESYPRQHWLMCAKRLDVAANFMDESAVFTIHSWCNKMLQQHAFESGNPFHQDVNTDDAQLLNHVIYDYWRIHFYDLSKMQCDFIVRHVAESPDAFADKINDLLKETEALKFDNFHDNINVIFESWLAWSDQHAKLENTAKAAWLKDIESINDLLIQANSEHWLNGNQYRRASFHEHIDEINHWAKNNEPYNIQLMAKFGCQRLTNGLVNAHQDKATRFHYSAFKLIDQFVSHCAQEQSKDILKRINVHATHWIRNRYQQEKKKRSRVTFDDMIHHLDNALQGQNAQRLADVIAAQYPVALIDEFQDTDPIQYRIFSRIYQDHSAATCFMIGDPKQAIYSFRGADIFTYLKAHQTTQHHHTLDTNFRSTHALVTAINQLFSQADKQEKGAFRFKNNAHNPLPFLPVKAKGRPDHWIINQQTTPALTFWHWESAQSIPITAYRDTLANVTASEIVRLLCAPHTGFQSDAGLRPLKQGDIAILVRNRNEAKLIRRALEKRQLKSVYLSEQDSIYDTEEAYDMLLWLEAMANPRNERKVRAAISTATVGFSVEQLTTELNSDVHWETHLARFLGFQTCWQTKGILPALRLLIHEYALHFAQKKTPNERQLTNVLHLAERLQQHASQIDSEDALIRHFATLITVKEQRAHDESVIRLESDDQLIKIITIHKSKGLEYPLVFLPFVCDAKEIDSKKSFFKYHNDAGEVCIDLDKAIENKNRQDEERWQEDLRLLYVALTRAQYACWLGIALTKDRFETSAIGYLLAQSTDNLNQIKGDCASIAVINLPTATEERFNAPQQHNNVACVKTAHVSLPENWWVASYSALHINYQSTSHLNIDQLTEIETAQEDAQREDVDLELPSEDVALNDTQSLNELTIYTLPKGAKPGVLIHTLFEKCADIGFHLAHSDHEWRQKTIQDIFADHVWQDPHHQVINAALVQWLETPLGTPNNPIKLMELDQKRYKSEFAFLMGADSVSVETLDTLITHASFNQQNRPKLVTNQMNGFLKGFIDLVFCYHDQYYIIDYKFNYLGKSAEHYSDVAMQDAMLNKRYDVQYALYLLALHRLLKVRLGATYDYDTHVGGVIYFFLRGNRQFFNKPTQAFVEQLDQLFCGQAKDVNHAK
jgi:exodeoxyribonuclease V beta subunit